jgi:hypothetical protein
MVEIEPNLRKYNDTQNLRRQDLVVVSRIRMGYTRLTEAYRLDNSPQPQFQICQTSISVPHIVTSYGYAASTDIKEHNTK